jgi:uncharacterized DUF497 family protein
MTWVRIEWDPAKNRSNRRKHGIAFEEAKALFEGNADYLVIFDDENSDDEDRFFAIGPIVRGVITVVYVERGDDVIRIISARRSTRRERARFRQHIGGGRR